MREPVKSVTLLLLLRAWCFASDTAGAPSARSEVALGLVSTVELVVEVNDGTRKMNRESALEDDLFASFSGGENRISRQSCG